MKLDDIVKNVLVGLVPPTQPITDPTDPMHRFLNENPGLAKTIKMG